MKNIKVLIFLAAILLPGSIMAQNHRVLTFYSYCFQNVGGQPYQDFHLFHTSENPDSSITIEVRIAITNCGTVYVYTATIDSNRIVLTEQVVDTVLLTCMCDIRIIMQIDSFPYFNNNYIITFGTDTIVSSPEYPNKNETYFRAVPNPATSSFYLDTPGPGESTEVQVYDILGRLQLHQTVAEKHENIDISMLPDGIYFIRTSTREGALKLVKVSK